MDYINILSKEPVMAVPVWIAAVAAALLLLLLLMFLLVLYVKYGRCKSICIGFSGMIVLFITFVVFLFLTIFCKEPTGRYKYSGTIDKDNITVSEYEEFIKEYNPTIIDDIYYWEE